MRVEMRHYRAHCTAAADALALAALRLECASLLADALAVDVSGAELLPSLTDAISFYAYPDAQPALERLTAAGLKLAVVANWDISLHDVLARVGLAGFFDVVVTAAAVGVAKARPAAVPGRARASRRGGRALRPRGRRPRDRCGRGRGGRPLRAPDRPQRARRRTPCATSPSSRRDSRWRHDPAGRERSQPARVRNEIWRSLRASWWSRTSRSGRRSTRSCPRTPTSSTRRPQCC